MASDRMTVGIVILRKPLTSPWAEEAWLPHAVLPAVPLIEEGSMIGEADGGETYYAGSAELDLYAGQTGHYRDNLVSGRPSVWVALRPGDGSRRSAFASVDPYEGESMAEGIGEVVEAVPMPSLVQTFVQSFIDAHHVERPFIKRQRDKTGDRESGGRTMRPPKSN